MEFDDFFFPSLAHHLIVVHEDTSDADDIKPMPCPLCNSKVRLYQIHYNEAVLMCANINCPYPFDVDDCHVYKIECHDQLVDPEYRSVGAPSVATGSVLSHKDWTDMDKSLLIKETQSLSLTEKPDIEKITNVKKTKEKEAKIKKDVKHIIQLNRTLFELDNSLDSINSTKWLNSIAEMQERSGIQLLNKVELQKVKTTIPNIGLGELKIDVDPTRNVISVKIEPDPNAAPAAELKFSLDNEE